MTDRTNEPSQDARGTALRVVSAACRSADLVFSMPQPARHADILLRIGNVSPDNQGFLLSNGKFANRRRAYQIAKAAGQITKRLEGPKYYQGDELFSEDMW